MIFNFSNKDPTTRCALKARLEQTAPSYKYLPLESTAPENGGVY